MKEYNFTIFLFDEKIFKSYNSSIVNKNKKNKKEYYNFAIFYLTNKIRSRKIK